MNEQIQELWKRAGGHYNRGNQHTWPEYTIDDPEKFAELIVKECASICELNGQSYTHSFTPAKARLAESTSNHCGLMIKKHFGVEE
jgi:hypothetical protein